MVFADTTIPQNLILGWVLIYYTIKPYQELYQFTQQFTYVAIPVPVVIYNAYGTTPEFLHRLPCREAFALHKTISRIISNITCDSLTKFRHQRVPRVCLQRLLRGCNWKYFDVAKKGPIFTTPSGFAMAIMKDDSVVGHVPRKFDFNFHFLNG